MSRPKGGTNRYWSKQAKLEIIRGVLAGEKSVREAGREGQLSAESLIGWINDELYQDFSFATAENLYQVLREFIYYFNNLRLAYSLGYKTPVQFRTERGYP